MSLKSETFSLADSELNVIQDADGTISIVGQYQGMPVKQALPISNAQQCILLLDPDARRQPVFQNLICIDNRGEKIWTAKLPTHPDVFVEIESGHNSVIATTWSGISIVIDKNTGNEISRAFVK